MHLQPEIGRCSAPPGCWPAANGCVRPSAPGATRPPPGGGESPAACSRAAASLELLHASALVHDDVMDGSDTRRGDPSAHRQFESLHLAAERLGDQETFGRAGAILLGDLLVMWSVEMLERAGLPPAALPGALAWPRPCGPR